MCVWVYVHSVYISVYTHIHTHTHTYTNQHIPPSRVLLTIRTLLAMDLNLEVLTSTKLGKAVRRISDLEHPRNNTLAAGNEITEVCVCVYALRM
jgi:hypothetical protein